MSTFPGSCNWIQWKPTSTSARRRELSVWHYPDWDLNDINFFICNISKCHDQDNQDIPRSKMKQHNELIYKSSAMIFFFLLFFNFFFQWFGVSTKKRKRNTGKCKQFDPTTSLLHKKQWKKSLHLKKFSDFFFREKKLLMTKKLCRAILIVDFIVHIVYFSMRRRYTVCIVYYSVKK